MPRLPKYTLEHNERRGGWDLEQDKSGRLIKHFETKEDATERGALRKAIGPQGGSVKIQKTDGDFQEERTFPRSKDPRTSKG